MNEAKTWLEEGEALLAANPWDTPEFARGLELLRKSAVAGWIEAEVALGHVYAQVPSLPQAVAESVRWYRQAAERAHPVAQDRLADLYMLGRGLPRDDSAALGWYARTAAQAYPHALCNLAYMYDEGLGMPADSHAATKHYLRAVTLADPRGLFNLGLRYAAAGDESLSLVAHACLALAVYARYPLADEELTRLEVRLDPAARARAGTLAADLRLQLRAFQQRFQSDAALAADPPALLRFAEDNLAVLGEPALASAASVAVQPHRPDVVQNLSGAPRIFTVDNFVGASEAAHFINLAGTLFAPAHTAVLERLSGEQTAFSGEVAVFRTPDGDAVVRNVERRIARAFNLSAAQVEPLSVLRYRADDRYAAHVDYFDAARMENNRRHGDQSGQRIASFLVYLRAPEAGGETHYLKVGKKIAGRPRMALCHFNLTPAGEPDPLTLHTGEPVIRGEKWLARTTLRESPFF